MGLNGLAGGVVTIRLCGACRALWKVQLSVIVMVVVTGMNPAGVALLTVLVTVVDTPPLSSIVIVVVTGMDSEGVTCWVVWVTVVVTDMPRFPQSLPAVGCSSVSSARYAPAQEPGYGQPSWLGGSGECRGGAHDE